jgi:Fasciclin domain
MRQNTLISLSLLLSSTATAFLVFPDLTNLPSVFRNDPSTNRRPDHLQGPMNPGPALPEDLNEGNGNSDGELTISDILPKTRQINIFASLTRDIQSIAGRLQSTAPSDNTTLLAPLNSAMQKLPRKPWEDAPGDTNGVRAASNEDKAAQNLERFVSEHVVPTSPWKEGEEGKVKTLGGQELWWERDGEKKVVMPHGLVVDEVLGRVGNGEIWAVKGVVNYKE